MTEKELMKRFTGKTYKSIAGAIRYDCGPLIAQGLNRDVYECKHDPKWVVKIQRTQNFDNIIEWKIWNAFYHAPDHRKWFADCLTTTESGLVLIQKRVTHGAIEDYPKKVPAYFTDFKIQNYGWIGKRFVCCDYSNSLEIMTGIVPDKLRSAKWWTAHSELTRSKKILIKTKL